MTGNEEFSELKWTFTNNQEIASGNHNIKRITCGLAGALSADIGVDCSCFYTKCTL